MNEEAMDDHVSFTHYIQALYQRYWACTWRGHDFGAHGETSSGAKALASKPTGSGF